MKKNRLVNSLVLAGPLLFQALAAEKPNVIIIFNDDQGYQDLGCFGSPDIATPRIDQMAREGMKFTNFYVASSVSSASRAALLTGCYPQRVGIQGVLFPSSKTGLSPKHVTIAEVLKSAGYATAAVGKWHLGDQNQYLPTNQGFDSYYGIPYSNDMFPSRYSVYASDCLFRDGFSKDSIGRLFAALSSENAQPTGVKNNVPLMRNTECIEFPVDQSTITRRFADESIKFIQESVEEKKPFFLYLANTMPHVPLYASPEFKGKSKRGLYGDVIEEIDYNTGRIMDQLKNLGIEKNTILIYTSDNGPWLQKGKDGGSALPLFEGKFSSFEGGFRVPFIIKWSGQIPAGTTCDELAATIDLLPTLTGIAGATLPAARLDGKDVIDLWKGKERAKSPHEYYFMVFKGYAVRSGDWKYHKNQIFSTKKNQNVDSPALFNLKDDVGETKNVIDQYPEIAARLAKALDEHLQTHLNFVY